MVNFIPSKPMNWQQMLPGKLKTQLKPQVIAGMVLLTLAFSVVIGSQSWARNKIRSDYETKLFNAALGFTLYFEGGFSDHPSDVGGRTYRGITQAEYNVYRSNRGLPGLDVSQMSETELIEIYNSYWQGSEAAKMHPSLAIVMFDTSVNFGINNSITFLQQALGLPQTGVFDSETREALERGNNQYTALQIINERILYRYKRVQENPSQMAFFHGWLSRDYSLWGYVEKIKN
jgi:lysozyme family protein